VSRTKPKIAEAHDSGLIESTREIFLSSCPDAEGEDPGIDYRSSLRFITNLRILESTSSQPVIIHQYSSGGEWHAGMAIYDAIKASPCKFIFISYGLCASMGSIIAQAPYDKGVRLCTPNCDWLIHEGSCSFEGTYKQIFSLYEFEKITLDRCYEIYAECCKNTGQFFSKKRGTVKNFLKRQLTSKEDWWLTSIQAVDYGFVDGILGSDEYPTIKEIYKNL
jgi:ATP-dependent Clp protease protease subunit